MYLPYIADDAVVSKANMDRVIAELAHELLHPFLTLKDNWEDLIQKRPELKDIVNAGEDCRIEWINRKEGLQAGAVTLLVTLIEKLALDAIANGFDASHQNGVAWTIALLGRCRHTYAGILPPALQKAQDLAESQLARNPDLKDRVDWYLHDIFADPMDATRPASSAQVHWPYEVKREEPDTNGDPDGDGSDEGDEGDDTMTNPDPDGDGSDEGEGSGEGEGEGSDTGEGEGSGEGEDEGEGEGSGEGEGEGEGEDEGEGSGTGTDTDTDGTQKGRGSDEGEGEDESADGEQADTDGNTDGTGSDSGAWKFNPSDWKDQQWADINEQMNGKAELTSENGYQEWTGACRVLDLNA
jgi:hypothetical protein